MHTSAKLLHFIQLLRQFYPDIITISAASRYNRSTQKYPV